MGDGGPSLRARGQVEAPLVELGDQLPMLIRGGVFEQGFDGNLAAGIVGEGPAVELLGAVRVFERPVEETGQLHQRGSTVRPPQVRDGALQSSRRSGRVAQLFLGPRQTEQGGQVIRVVLERALEQDRSLCGVAELQVPDLAHLGREGGLLEGAHGKLSLNLGDLEGELPFLLRRVDLSQLHQRRLVARVQTNDALVGLRRSVDLQAALLENLGQPEGDLRPLLGLLLRVQVGRSESALVQGDEIVPLAVHEVMFFEGLEGGGNERDRIRIDSSAAAGWHPQETPLGFMDEIPDFPSALRSGILN